MTRPGVVVVAALLAGARVRVLEPPAGEVGRIYRLLASDGAEHIVSVHVSGSIHSLVAHAREAAAHASIPVSVVDTRSVGMGEGFAALAAAAGGSGPRGRCRRCRGDGAIVRTGGMRNTAPARDEVKRRMEAYVATLARPVVSVALGGGSAIESGLGISTPSPMIVASPGASLSAHAGPGTYIVSAANLPAGVPVGL
jgi:hypothetical protein